MRRAELRDWLNTTKVAPSARLVYLALCLYANPAQAAWPSVASLVDLTGLSRRGVQYALRELEAQGEVRAVSAAGRVTVYALSTGLGGCTQCAGKGCTQCAPPAHSVPKGAHSVRPKVVRREVGRKSAPTPKNGTAPPPQAGAVPFTDDQGTFLPGTGWVK